MREKSDLFFTKENKQNSQQSKQFRGGVTKVMKKKLAAFVLSSSMVLSMTVPAFAAATDSTPGKQLQDLGIILGNQNGDLMEEANWDREDVAVLISRLLGKEAEAKATAKGHTYKDVKGTYYDGFLTWAKAEKLMEGNSATDFGFDDDVTYKQFAAVVLRALGIDTTGDNYANVPALAVEAGLVPAGTNFDAVATRGATYGVLVTALNTVIPGTGQTLGNKLGLPGFEAIQLGLTSVAQGGAKTITVTFNKAASAEEKAALTFEVKNGLVPYTVTPKWAEDNKSVALEASFLPAGEYNVTVKGFDAKTVTVVDEKVSKLDITVSALQKDEKAEDSDLADLNIKAYNQFGEEVSNAGLNISAFNATKGINVLSGTQVQLINSAINDNIIVTATHAATATTVSKTLKVVAGSAATVVQLGTVKPVADNARISVNQEGFVLPYTLQDQYGQKITLPETDEAALVNGAVTIGGITFIVSNPAAVNNFAVDSDGVLTFETLANSGTVVITAINNTNGATGNTTVNVEAAAKVKTFQLSHPGVLVASGETVKFPFVAADTYGAAIKGTDLDLAQINLVSSNNAVPFTVAPSLNNKGELEISFSGSGATTVFAYIDGALVSQVAVDVKAVATPVKVSGIADVLTTVTEGATVAFDQDNIKFVDNYGRIKNVAEGDFTVSSNNADAVSYVDGELVGGDTTGSATITVALADVANSSYTFTVKNIAASEVKTFEIESIGTLYGKSDNSFVDGANAYAKTVSIVGKTSAGTKVAIVQDSFLDFVTTSDTTIVGANDNQIVAYKTGEATVSAWKSGKVVATIKVTASDAKAVATTVSFGADSYTATQKVTVTVKDQYGVALVNPVGYFYSDDKDVVSVDLTSGQLAAGTKKGEATITYVTANGVTKTVTATN
jgi:hypothetical protein